VRLWSPKGILFDSSIAQSHEQLRFLFSFKTEF
jgi:hypothetical protein